MTNKMRAWAPLMLWVPLALLAACSTEEKVKPVVVQKVVQSPGKAVVTVTEVNDGAGVVLETAQELRVELPTNSAAVTADMNWIVGDPKPAMLDVLGSRFERSPRDNNPAEAGGVTIWRLKPRAPGRATLTFELRKPHSLEQPTQTLSYDVTVK